MCKKVEPRLINSKLKKISVSALRLTSLLNTNLIIIVKDIEIREKKNGSSLKIKF